MNQEHHKTDSKSNHKGANYDIDKEIGGANDEGQYLDSRNGRVSSIRGNSKSWEKIRGEELEHSSNGGSISYCSIGTINVKNKKFTVWVDPANIGDPYIEIDGVVVSKSPDLNFLKDFPLQIDKNDNCLGGEVFLTDFNQPPFIFDVKDMEDSLVSSPTKYFADFNPLQYQVNLETPLNIPVFIGLENLGSGLPVGHYIYSLRYSNEAGDKTNWTPETPPIPVLRSLSTDSRAYPSTRTYGDNPDVSSFTSYGPRLRFRVDNVLDYDYIEVKRTPYNIGGGLNFVSASEIIARIDIFPGELSVRDFVDPTDSNYSEPIADDEEIGNQFFNVDKAKGIRYFDKRVVLMNVCTTSRDAQVDILGNPTEEMFPIVENIGKAGHNNPKNHVYKKSYMSGERYGFSFVGFDSFAGTAFAQPITNFDNFKFPNRRDPMTGDSLLESINPYNGIQYGNTAGENFEVFDMKNAVKKAGRSASKNIFENDPYSPYHPISQSDSYSDHEFIPTDFSYDGGGKDIENQVFGPEYIAKGIAMKGVTNIPSWMKSFSIARTEAAGRVICQGIGMYALTPRDGAGDNGTFKDLNRMWFYSADIDSALVSPSIVDDMRANPSQYTVELQSPLGFCTEIYSFDERDLDNNSDELIDMISYARIQHDNGQVNNGEFTDMGVPGPAGRHVGFDKWRSPNAATSSFPTSFTLQAFSDTPEVKRTSQGHHFEIKLSNNIYKEQYLGGTALSDTEFQRDSTRRWHEPFYIINIVRKGVNVKDNNVNEYCSTGHYQKIESKIALGTGLSNQEYILVDERREDCIAEPGSVIPRYIYIRNDNGIDVRWLDVTNQTVSYRNNAYTDINTLGYYIPEPGVKVYGLYTSRQDVNGLSYLVFDQFAYYPSNLETIYVKYDNRLPLKIFGGDTTVGETVFCPLDRAARAGDHAEQFRMDVGWPYRNYRLNGDIAIMRKAGGVLVDNIQDSDRVAIGRVRQLLIMYTSENRSALHYTWNEVNDSQSNSFPLIHYVQRPNDFDAGKNVVDNRVHAQYETDFPGERDLWFYGGFKYHQNTNIDYASGPEKKYFSKPEIGFVEQICFCTKILWSLARPINVQNAPGLKTFLSNNSFDLDDDSGAIKKAYSAMTRGKGENLYAFTDHGICLALTKKSILSNINADNVEVLASDEFIGGQYWLSRDIGMNDEMWRSGAEGTISVDTPDGAVEMEAIYFANDHSIYKLIENQIKDIGELNYFNKLNPVLKEILAGYSTHVTGFLNEMHNEYWVEIDNPVGERLIYNFGQENLHWQGELTYNFDRYLYSQNKMFGMRNGETYELEKGYVINGANIEAWLMQTASSDQRFEKEFIDIQSNSIEKPTRIEFLDRAMNVMCALDQSIQGPLYLKKYNGYRQFIPRKDLAYDVDRKRVQSRLLIYKIIHNLPEDFKIIDNFVKYKILK